jgi:aminomethyltransferase
MAVTSLQRYFEQRGIAQVELAGRLATPVRFTDPVSEHLATRHAAGLADFSFVASIEITGRDSLIFLHHLQTRNLARLPPGRLAYTLMLRRDGTVLNDATIWCLGKERYGLFTGRRSDFDHVCALAAGFSVSIADRSVEHAVIAVQGVQAWPIISRCLSGLPAGLPYYSFTDSRWQGAACRVARIAYSGETGYELITDAMYAPGLWRALLAAGTDYDLAECGFDAIDSLRIEAGHILFTRELAMAVTPFELGLGRLLDFYRDADPGMDALRRMRWQAPRQCLVGLLLDEVDTLVPYVTACILPGTARLTSSCISPIFGRRIGLGFVTVANRHPGTRVEVAAGVSARVARLPFYDPAKILPRRMR